MLVKSAAFPSLIDNDSVAAIPCNSKDSFSFKQTNGPPNFDSRWMFLSGLSGNTTHEYLPSFILSLLEIHKIPTKFSANFGAKCKKMYLYPLYSSQYIAGNILTLTDFSFFFKPLVHPVIQQALPSFGFVSFEDGKQTFLKGIFLIFPCSMISNFNLTYFMFSTLQF